MGTAVVDVYTSEQRILTLELRFRRARTGHKTPPPRSEIRKIRENYKIPHPELGPENTKKMTGLDSFYLRR